MPIEKLRQEGLKVIAKYSNLLNIYSDGSVSNGRTGIGLFTKYYHECTRLPDGISIFTAEAQAILQAMKYGISRPERNDFTIFTDSLSCLTAIRKVSEKHPIIARIQNIMYHSSINIHLCWIPSHCDLLGN